MALPLIESKADIEFSNAVSPYIPQLYGLFQKTFQSALDPQALKELYLSTNPLISALAFSLFLAPVFLIVSELNKNHSQVDRFWSILPTVYNTHYAIYAHALGLPTRRLDTVLVLSTLWSIRLTYNYWRKGGYSKGSEDYRWEILRKYISPAWYFIFNVLFISLAQMLLLFAVTTPTYLMVLDATRPQQSSSSRDFTYPLIQFALLYTAYEADQQQWDFHAAKKEYQKTAKVPAGYHQTDLDRGFNTTGLFAWSRHPNFAAEQSFWVTLYIWASFVTDTRVNWTIVGPVAYLILFQGSTYLTEWISANKYPEYKEYRRRVGMFIPRIFSLKGAGPGDFSDKRTEKELK